MLRDSSISQPRLNSYSLFYMSSGATFSLSQWISKYKEPESQDVSPSSFKLPQPSTSCTKDKKEPTLSSPSLSDNPSPDGPKSSRSPSRPEVPPISSGSPSRFSSSSQDTSMRRVVWPATRPSFQSRSFSRCSRKVSLILRISTSRTLSEKKTHFSPEISSKFVSFLTWTCPFSWWWSVCCWCPCSRVWWRVEMRCSTGSHSPIRSTSSGISWSTLTNRFWERFW